MNILGWELHFRSKHTELASPFTCVLPKVRTMRETCGWPPATTPSTVEQRKSRILAARRSIAYRPVPHERVADCLRVQSRSRWLWMGVLLVLLAAGVVLLNLSTSESNREARRPARTDQRYQYQFPVAPPFLSESMALTFARTALSSSGLDQDKWMPEVMTNRNDNFAPDGSRDTYLVRTPPRAPNSGAVIFESERAEEPERIVHLQLLGAQLLVVILPTK